MITDTSTNRVALKWTLPRTAPQVVIDGTDRVYTFIPKSNIWMAWVEQIDVDRLLKQKAKVCNCNNGTYRKAFEFANRLDVLLWETGGREGTLNSNYVEM